MADDTVNELNELLRARAAARAQIVAYVEANADLFVPYLEMIAEHDDLTIRATHKAKQLSAEDTKCVNVEAPVKLTKTSRSTVDIQSLVKLAGAEVFANYPTLVKSIDVTRMAALHPAVLRDHTLVDDVSIGAVRDLTKVGALPASAMNAVSTTTTYSISGLEPFGSG